MIKTVGKILKSTGYPVLWQKRPRISNKPSLSYHFFSEQDEFYGNGKSLASGGALQVDIFSKSDYSDVVAKVKKVLTEKGFRFAEMHDEFEKLTDTEELYHKIMIFNYIESEVKNV
ncbi:hypothetical protein [Filifactor alocis]|uniref:hypothetical protein n=1 Tax=Filifactor alocis TaxID=143361 RepID=UPI0028E938D2|nr:hypothetical protein [Filifactor alocis]